MNIFQRVPRIFQRSRPANSVLHSVCLQECDGESAADPHQKSLPLQLEGLRQGGPGGVAVCARHHGIPSESQETVGARGEKKQSAT